MKVAIFHLAFVYSGGGEKLVLEEAKGLRKRGHQVTIFTPILDKKKCFPDIIDQLNIKTLVPNLPSIIPQREVFQVLLACVLAPVLAYRFKDFDVILAANQPSPWLAFWAKKFFGVPYVTYLSQPTRFLHLRKIDRETGLIFAKKRAFSPATYLMKMAKPLANWADRASIEGSDLVLADGEYVKRVLEEIYGIKTISCPAGAYPATKPLNYASRYRGMLKVADKAISKPYILLTNRHFPQKKLEYAITALPAVLRKSPNLLLAITGRETDYTQALKNLVKQLSLDEKVLFLGLVKEEDLEKLYSQAAVYVYPAPEEDFGMGIVEAMAAGTPVVAWNNGGPTGTVSDGETGFLAEPYDSEDFTEKMLRLAIDRDLAERMGRVGHRRAKEMFSYQRHNRILEKALVSAVPGRRPSAQSEEPTVAHLERHVLVDEPGKLRGGGTASCRQRLSCADPEGEVDV